MKPSKVVTDVWVSMNLAQRGIYRAIDAALKEAELPPLRWYDVLWELERSQQGLRPFELERLVIFEQSNISRLVQRMVDEGHIVERPYRRDGRGKVLHLTAKGRKTRAQIWSVYGPLIQQYVGPLAEQHDAKAVAQALTSLVDRDRRTLRSNGTCL